MGYISKCTAIVLGLYFFLAIHFYNSITQYSRGDEDIVWLTKDQIDQCLGGHLSPHERNSREEQQKRPPVEEVKETPYFIERSTVRDVEDAVRIVIEKNGGEKHEKETFQKYYTENTGLLLIERFYNGISNNKLYSDSSPLIDQLLNEMARNKIVDVEDLSEEGTSLKFQMKLKGGIIVVFKPKREEIDYVVPADIKYFHALPRHFAEVSAFHLDRYRKAAECFSNNYVPYLFRVFGFNRVAPAIGYALNIERDVFPVASDDLKELFYKSPVGNTCICGICDDCPRSRPICTRNNTVEGAIIIFFPSELNMVDGIVNPWRRSYSKPPEWEADPTGYCKEQEVEQPEFFRGRIMLDVIDQHVFDFMIDNMDRHHLATFSEDYGDPLKQTFLLSLDNDSGFGKLHDELSITAPIFDCCKIRLSTVKKLLKFTPLAEEFTETLSDALRRSLRTDPLGKPMLSQKHIHGVDRRVLKLIEIVHKCVDDAAGDASKVIIDDGF